MATLNLTIGQVGITQKLLVILYEVSLPTVEVRRLVFDPPHPTARNFVVNDLNPVTHYIEYRESSDGVALGNLFGKFTVKVTSDVVIAETLFYRVDGVGTHDPIAGATQIIDPYLDGKNITQVFREGFRSLISPGNVGNEYDLVPGGGVQFLGGLTCSSGEVFTIGLSYTAATAPTLATGMYNGIVTLTGNTTIGATHYNKRIRCESSASARMVVTLSPLSSTPDGTLLYFNSNAGNQLQTKILCSGADVIRYNGINVQELSFSKGEYIVIEKRGAFWDEVQSHHGVMMVGERVAATFAGHSNTLPEDGRLLDGDDYPRIWFWIKNIIPASHYISDSNVTSISYARPFYAPGMFIVHPTLKKFRLPDTRNLSERGMKYFDGSVDVDRPGSSAPGVYQAEMVGQHKHPISGKTERKSGTSDFIKIMERTGIPDDWTDSTEYNTGTENRVKNFGVIYLRRI